ncbi:MAG: DUF998 domain-containing protein [Thermoplasmatota archaeon]
MERKVPVTRRPFLAWLGLAGTSQFVVALLVLHAAWLPHEPRHVSEFARGRLSWLWPIGAYAFTVGGLSLTLAMAPHLPLRRSPLARAALLLMAVATLGSALVATFPVDAAAQSATLPGTIHDDAALASFGAMATAMLLLVPDLRGSPAWRAFADLTLVLGLLAAAASLAYIATDHAPWPEVAIVQRVLLAAIAGWSIVLGLQLLNTPRPRPT